MSLKQRILEYYKRHHTTRISSAAIERIAADKMPQRIASNASRRLRELHEAGYLDRKYKVENGKRLAYYRFKPQLDPLKVASEQVAFFENYPNN